MASRLTTFIVVLIVAGTLIAGLIVGAQRDDESGPVDLIVTNGRVYIGSASRFAEAVAIRGNKILRVGTNREVKRLRRAQTTVVDAHGGSVLPGFNDAHVHLIGGGLALSNVNLLDATTLESIQETVKAFAASHLDRPWVRGRGWYYDPFPGGLPTRQQLDAVVPDRPAYLVAYDGHTGWANTKALQAAGITRRTPSPAHGVIVKDPRTGEPTGVLKEAAQALMQKVLPQPTRADKLAALRGAIQEAQRLGITSVQNAGGSAEDLALFEELREAGELQLRVYAALSVTSDTTADEMQAIDAARRKYQDDPLLKAGAVKLMADGVIESHTAAMLAPYANKATTGAPYFSPDDLARLVGTLDKNGWQILVHAIGDGAVRMSLDAIEQAARTNPTPPRGRRHRLEHIETIDPADIARFGALGVIASQQPFHGTPAPSQIAVWTANIGDLRASRGWAYHSIMAAGGRLAFGSDWPVVTLDPRAGIHTAVTRMTPDGEPESGWYPAERIPLAAAVDAYTSGAAWASFDEQRKGTLARDLLADVVVLSSDIFRPDARVIDAVVDTTIFDGRIVYTRPPSSTPTQ
jgi:predicted amidohydrolase YtcJ